MQWSFSAAAKMEHKERCAIGPFSLTFKRTFCLTWFSYLSGRAGERECVRESEPTHIINTIKLQGVQRLLATIGKYHHYHTQRLALAVKMASRSAMRY